MTLQTITPPTYLGPRLLRDNTAVTYTLDANGEYVAWIIQAPKTGTIDRIHFYATTVTADGDGLRCRIETVSATDGKPTGTLAGGGSEVTHTTTTAHSWNRGTAGLSASVTRGDFIAVMLKSPAAGTTFNGIIRSTHTNQLISPVSNGALVPYIVNALPTAAAAQPGAMCFALEYNDGTTPYIDGAVPISSITGSSVTSASTPDERGNLFQVPVPTRVIGVTHAAYCGGANGAMDLVLYNNSGTALATLAVDTDQYRATATAGSACHYFSSPVELAANTNYRIVIKPTSGTITFLSYTVDTTAGGTRLRTMLTSGTTWQRTTRTDAGAWTDTPDSYECIGIIVDQFDDGAGGSGGFPSSSALNGVLQR